MQRIFVYVLGTMLGLLMLATSLAPLQAAEAPVRSQISWQVYHAGMARAATRKRHVFVQFFADWCGYCRRMDKEVFSDRAVRKVLDKYFVPIRVTEKSRRRVRHGQKWLPEGDLITHYQVSGYPTLLFMDSSGKEIGKVPGFVDARMMRGLLLFVGTKSHEKMDYAQFEHSELPKLKG